MFNKRESETGWEDGKESTPYPFPAISNSPLALNPIPRPPEGVARWKLNVSKWNSSIAVAMLRHSLRVEAADGAFRGFMGVMGVSGMKGDLQ